MALTSIETEEGEGVSVWHGAGQLRTLRTMHSDEPIEVTEEQRETMAATLHESEARENRNI